MNRQEANQLLNQVREGVLHPPSAIIKALTLTGDIHDKCPNLDSTADRRCSSCDSPDMPDAAVQNLRRRTLMTQDEIIEMAKDAGLRIDVRGRYFFVMKEKNT
jgi:hypothetical protein